MLKRKISFYKDKIKKTYAEEGLKGVLRKTISKIKGHLYSKKIHLINNFRRKNTDLNLDLVLTQNETSGKTTSDICAFTIVSKNYMHYALAVRDSFLKHNKNADFIICIMDLLTEKHEIKLFNQLISKGVKILFFKEVKNTISNKYNLEEMLFKYNILEMNTAIKPFIMEHLLRKNYKYVFYFDPDIYFYKDISELVKPLNEYDIVVTPHITQYYPNDDKKPSEIDILMAGIYNLGFIGVKNTSNSLDMLRWWQDKLFDGCFMDIHNGMHVDQKWIDLVGCLFDNVYVLKHPGCNVAYWNLHERNIVKEGSNWFVNGKELIFFHYSGLPLDNIDKISKHQSRYSLKTLSHLRELFEDYKNNVNKFAPDLFRSLDYFYNYVASTDIKLIDFVRRDYYKLLLKDINNPFLACKNSLSKFISFMTSDVFGDGLINRIMYSIWKKREDLREVFDIEKDKEDRKKFASWFSNSASSEYKLNHEFTKVNTKDIEYNKIFNGINLVGYFENVIGVAEIARLFFKKSYNSGVPMSLFKLKSEVHPILGNEELYDFKNYYSEAPLYEKNIFFVNADEINNVQRFFPLLFDNKYNAAVWWWEFEDYFYFQDSFKYLDEIIVFSDFIKKAIDKAAPANVKIRKMTYPFIPNWKIIYSRDIVRKKFGLNKDDFVFMFTFDFFSGFERKNPMSILNAFRNVVHKNNNVKLLLKMVNHEKFINEYNLILKFIKENSLEDKVILITESLSRNELMSLTNSIDCYISLHRSEGFGLTLLEAMYLGKPVIATNYGGNLEFMNEENSLLVDYKLVELEKDFGPYKKGWLWAEPNVEHASLLMEKLIEDDALREKISKQAYESTRAKYDSNLFTKDLYNFLLDIN